MTDLRAMLRLMLVTDDRLLAGREPVEVCLAAERGGVTCIQLRLKQASARELAALARALLARLKVPLLVNDRADVAIAAGAAGVHLGPDDVPVPLVRRIAPRGFVIGASVGTPAEVEGGRGADYWGIGPWRATTTKGGVGQALGPEGMAALVRRAEGRPCVAIGGVRPEDQPQILSAGGVGAAVVSGVLAHDDPTRAALRYAERLEEGDAQGHRGGPAGGAAR